MAPGGDGSLQRLHSGCEFEIYSCVLFIRILNTKSFNKFLTLTQKYKVIFTNIVTNLWKVVLFETLIL